MKLALPYYQGDYARGQRRLVETLPATIGTFAT
jgi:hypothetical protein